MDDFFDQLEAQTATIDELLSNAFEPITVERADTDLAARRLAAWCRSSASNNWSIFSKRLERDGLSTTEVLSRFGPARRSVSSPVPIWLGDAIWIESALRTSATAAYPIEEDRKPLAFQQIVDPVVAEAYGKLRSSLTEQASNNLAVSAYACLCGDLTKQLSDLLALALYDRFDQARANSTNLAGDHGRACYRSYDQFIAAMKNGGIRALFEDKPVLLRLLAVVTRQWIDTTLEFVERLSCDFHLLRTQLLRSHSCGQVVRITNGVSDRHNEGRSVVIAKFEDGSSVVYKPKDMRLDAAWRAFTEHLNSKSPPVSLKSARVIACHGYGWSEFIAHSGCETETQIDTFFSRCGALLALLHGFSSSDMHEENIIACGEYPVPVDLEVLFQTPHHGGQAENPGTNALDAARGFLENSVLMTGLLPTLVMSPDNYAHRSGGMTEDWVHTICLSWRNINSDQMAPEVGRQVGNAIPNLPHVNGVYARFEDHVDDFVLSFENYAKFLRGQLDREGDRFLDSFAGLSVRKIIRPTAFYDLLLGRMKHYQAMDDGVCWSAQVDFLARFIDWDSDSDEAWLLQRAERSALLTLNIPYFTSASDSSAIADSSGNLVELPDTSGIARALSRIAAFDDKEIAQQSEIIRQTAACCSMRYQPASVSPNLNRFRLDAQSGAHLFISESENIVQELSRLAVLRNSTAAWIGVESLGLYEAAQLAPLGADLYNGTSGIALYLSAHAAVTGNRSSKHLALAAVSQVRKMLNGGKAVRFARYIGIGAGRGLGSIVYAFTVMAKLLADDSLLGDAYRAAELFTDDLIFADDKLDVMGGSAGGILCLLRLYRQTQNTEALRLATKCGLHLLAQTRDVGSGSWLGVGSGERALAGLSHGAAGYAYALASLESATGLQNFGTAAAQCLAFENSLYDTRQLNWPDLRIRTGSSWPCRWCHGAVGIGLARAAMARLSGLDIGVLTTDVERAVACAERLWSEQVDTLCCGSLGSIELLHEAAALLDRQHLHSLAELHMAAIIKDADVSGDYRWIVSNRNFNVGLFRGLAGVGYTCLRRVDSALPNILVWE